MNFLIRIKEYQKLFFINIFIFILILISLELCVRLAVFVKFNKFSVGLTERTNYLSYQPFTMFGKNYYTFFKDVKENINDEEYNILLTGGSTAEGFDAKILEKEIEKTINKSVNVFNAASASFNSSQELIVLTQSLDIDFDLIISISGANDLLHSIIPSNIVGSFYLNQTYSIILRKPYLSPLVFILNNSQLYKITRRFNKINNLEKSKPYEHANYLVDNILRLQKVSKVNSSNYIFLLQPYLGFKEILSESEKNFTLYEYRNDLIKSLYNHVDSKLKIESLKNNLNYIDGRYIYKTNKTIFSDDAHFKNDTGYLILAKEISRKLNSIIDN